VARWARGTYQCDGRGTSWLKIKNQDYSQMENRHELFESRRQPALSSRRAQAVSPALFCDNDSVRETKSMSQISDPLS
jgi:ATP-dependent DNA ligase